MVRTALWAGFGAVASVGWGVYFATADKAVPMGPIISTLARLTQPAVAVGLHSFNFPLGLRLTVAANAATYALLGLIVETVRSDQSEAGIVRNRRRELPADTERKRDDFGR